MFDWRIKKLSKAWEIRSPPLKIWICKRFRIGRERVIRSLRFPISGQYPARISMDRKAAKEVTFAALSMHLILKSSSCLERHFNSIEMRIWKIICSKQSLRSILKRVKNSRLQKPIISCSKTSSVTTTLKFRKRIRCWHNNNSLHLRFKDQFRRFKFPWTSCKSNRSKTRCTFTTRINLAKSNIVWVLISIIHSNSGCTKTCQACRDLLRCPNSSKKSVGNRLQWSSSNSTSKNSFCNRDWTRQ